jgi:hypothetical protein
MYIANNKSLSPVSTGNIQSSLKLLCVFTFCKEEELYSLSYRDTDLWGEAPLLRISGHSYREIVTPWNKVRFMNLIAVQLVKKFPLFFEPDSVFTMALYWALF